MTAGVDAFFTGRGWQPFAFQREVWEAYARGESGLVHAPTGTGKTYAVWLGPVVEALAERRPAEGLRVLWLTPLRALAKDTAEALRAPLEDLGLDWSVELRTGDTSSAARARQRKRFPNALVTTPESLTLLLSYPDARPRFRHLRAVIVDEWHELLSTKRGTQTELALARLRGWVPGLRVWGLSATLANLAEAAATLVGEDAPCPVIVRGALPRPVEVTTLVPDAVERFPWAGHMSTRMLPQVLEALEVPGSTLLFTNTRSQAELWHRSIVEARADWADTVAIHHGSLDRATRGAVEDGLRAGTLRCVVATSSLDLGVDFPAVQQVIQVGSPKGVARLLQRAGRSGHQPGGTARLLCVPNHALELVEFAAARDAMAALEVEARAPLQRPLDVLVQHLVTVGAGGGFTEDDLLAEVRSTRAFRALSDGEWAWALDFVARGGGALGAYDDYRRLRQEDGRWTVASPRLGKLHRLGIGTITSDAAMDVRFLRGARLGSVEESFLARLRPGEVFSFGGRSLELVRIRDMTAWVRLARKGKGAVPRWYGGRLPMSTQLADGFQARLAEAAAGRFEGPEMAAVAPLLELQERVSRLPRPGELLVETVRSREGWHAFLFPFAGRLAHEGMATLLSWRLARGEPRSLGVAVNDYGFELVSPQPLDLDAEGWRALLAPHELADDLAGALNAAELDRRQFREIARVAGLVFQGYPGRQKSARQLQASSGLFYDVFRNHDPGNLLVEQARREVLERQLEVSRLRAALESAQRRTLHHLELERFSPLAFPIWVSRVQVSLSTEKWIDRARRMAAELEARAG